MKKLTRYFLEGLLLLVPIVASVYIVYAVFIRIDTIFGFKTRGIGFAVTLITITAVGFVSSNFLAKRLMNTIDSAFTRLPLVKMIYTSLKNLVDAFVGDKKSFDKPVLVTLSTDSNIQIIGFMTREGLDNLGLSDKVAVYLPQSFNFAGNLIIVPREQVTRLSAESSEIMAFIVSGGVASR